MSGVKRSSPTQILYTEELLIRRRSLCVVNRLTPHTHNTPHGNHTGTVALLPRRRSTKPVYGEMSNCPLMETLRVQYTNR